MPGGLICNGGGLIEQTQFKNQTTKKILETKLHIVTKLATQKNDKKN